MPCETASTPAPAAVRLIFDCPDCGAPNEAVMGTWRDCYGCRRTIAAWAFPRLGAQPPEAIPVPEIPIEHGDATCFCHPQRPAERACDSCGRYICSLCDIAIAAQHVCPGCLAHPPSAQLRDSLRTEEFGHDRCVLAMGWLWPLFWPSWIVVAPTCWYFTIRHWKEPARALVPRSPWRYVAGDLLLLWPALLIPLFVVFARMRR